MLIAYRGLASYPRADASGRPEDTGLAPGWAILADDPPPGMAVWGAQPDLLALNYLTQIWGRRPDVRPVTAQQAQALLFQGLPLAVTEAVLPLAPAELSPAARYSALGRTLVGVSLRPSATLPSGLAPWTHDFAGVVRLIGGKFEANRASGEQVVMLAWQPAVRPADDWSVSVRLLREAVQIAQLDRGHPVFGAYPMTRWTPGEIVIDSYAFALPAGGDPDRVMVVLYRRAADGEFVNLDVAHFALR